MQSVMRLLALITIVLLPSTMTARAQSSNEPTRSEVEIRGIVSIPSGTANFSGTSSGDTTIDFKRDFDFGNKLGFAGRYTYRSTNKKHKFLAEYNTTKWSRDTTLSRTFTFLGQTYIANLAASGDLRLNVYRVMYAYRWGTDKLRIGPMFDMGVVSTRIAISGTTNNGTRSGERTVTKFAASIGYDLDYEASPNINLFSNLGAIAFQGEHFFHTDNGARFYFTKHFGASGGYRFERYKLKKDDNFVTVRAHGPFFGGLIRF